ncbi:hypothetical protein ROA7450_03578 [Roseovarius albus]|uniref:Phytanoyl-CoA dioxygenase (PhyH) n=1 Tax=Roseovarius albus TaxID=1247867 RepID=A0A1X7A0Z6_9RHOB|nr:hypothetical protein [Roseovarius albus]SLN67189.1 hypothetical protein ROA7450_03578 [Roseovarius albus]
MVNQLLEKGWVKFGSDPSLNDWLAEAHSVAVQRVQDPEQQREWLQCEGTWFVGVDTLPNDTEGAVGPAGPLQGTAYQAARDLYGDLPLHRGQVSVMYPGYPKPRDGEAESAFRYRTKRDAAHVDGLLAVGPERKRMLKEPHAYILGLPLTSCDPEASPLIVWEGSHHIMQAAFKEYLSQFPVETWQDADLTQIYQAARNKVFETCPRIELPANPGEATLLHRHILHGVAAWKEGAYAPEEGRMIAYFRPEFVGGAEEWLSAP